MALEIAQIGYDYMQVLQEDDGIFNNSNIYHHHHQESGGGSILDAYCGDYSSSSSVHVKDQYWEWDPNYSSPEGEAAGSILSPPAAATTEELGVGRRKRRRTKNGKNKEEMENQRMTHITVERNRRKQMNEYLAVIRSLMPSSYAQRGDQASIVGGAINFVKELEQQLQTLEVQKRDNIKGYNSPPPLLPPPFGDFFAFPQYSIHHAIDGGGGSKNRSRAMAEIEVTMVESHANLKILSKKRQRQLLKMVAGLQCLLLTILHLNVTTMEQMVLYTLSVKLDDGCHLSTVDEIADEVNCLLCRIEEESLCSN